METIARGAPGLQAEFTGLNRDYDILVRNYRELLGRREAMRITAAADTEADKIKMQIIDPPQVPRIPVSPRRGLLITAVLLAGFAAGSVAAFGLQQMDRSFRTSADMQALGLPVAGSISLVADPMPPLRAAVAAAPFAAAAFALCAVWVAMVAWMLHAQGAA